MIQLIEKPKVSKRMIRMAALLRQAADQAEAGHLESICLVFVERGPKWSVRTRCAIDRGKFTMLGALAAAQAGIIQHEDV
jgi:ornithine carbamoyltransferase